MKPPAPLIVPVSGRDALILYHADCTDGACAAWAARHHCERAGYTCTLIPAHPHELVEVAVVPWPEKRRTRAVEV